MLQLDELDLIAGVARIAGQSPEIFPVRIDAAADVEGALEAIVTPALQLDLPERLIERALAHHVDEAAGRALPKHHRGGAAQKLDPLHAVKVDLRRDEAGVALQLHAVEVAIDDEAAIIHDVVQAKVAAAV